MKPKLLLLFCLMQFSLFSHAQIFNQHIRFGMNPQIADSILGAIEIPPQRLANIEFCGINLKTNINFNRSDYPGFGSVIREVSYRLNETDIEDIIKEKPLIPTKIQKQELKEQYKGYFYFTYDEDHFIKNMFPCIIDTIHFNKIIRFIIESGFILDSTHVELRNTVNSSKSYHYSKNQQQIILKRHLNLFMPNYIFDYWHYGNVEIKERSPNFISMENDEKTISLKALNKDNIFNPFTIESSYDKSKKLAEKEINIKIDFKFSSRRCTQYKPTGIDYIDGAFEIRDVFGKILQTFEGFQFNVKDCMPTITDEIQKVNCNYYTYSLSPDESWSSELLTHLSNNYDIEVALKVNKIRFEDGEIWD